MKVLQELSLGLFQSGADGVRSVNSGSEKWRGALCLPEFEPEEAQFQGTGLVAGVLGAEWWGWGWGRVEVPGVGSSPGFWARTLMGSTDVWLRALGLLWLPVAAASSPPTPSPAHLSS